jgi:hypothetical protein
MSWQQYVQAAQQLGFTKVTIIDKASYQPVAYTSAADIATAWQDGDIQVNENQELLDNWGPNGVKDKEGKAATKKNFCFYGKRFNILVRDEEDGNWIVCLKGKEVCIARKFNAVYFLVYGETASKSVKKDDKADKTGSFASAPDAFNKICKGIFDALEESGV